MKKFLLLGLLGSALLSACSTDIDINAEWKDTTLALGLLNPTDQTHYLRIHKAYLDEKTGALEIASIKDSLYYSTLDVRIERLSGDNVVQTFVCERIDTNLLQPGLFSSPEMVLYKFSTGGNLDSSSTYRLVIETPYNNTVTGSLRPIGNATSLPLGLPPGGQVPPSFPGINWSNQVQNINLRAPLNAKMYELTIRVFYDEWNRFNVTPTDTPGLQIKFVDWKSNANQLVKNVNTNETTQLRINGRNMFSYLNAVLPVDPNVNRRLRGTLFIFDFADDNLNTFLQINRPSSSVVDVRPTFTNIENGLGIFASRRSVPSRSIVDNYTDYEAFFSPYFREALGGVGTDSLRTRYPELNFVP